MCLSAKVQQHEYVHGTSVCTLRECVCVRLHVFISVFSLCVLNPQIIPPFILSSSSLTSLILSSLALFFHPALYPFTSLSRYLSLASTAPVPLPCSFLFAPFHHHLQSLILPSLHPSGPSSSQTQQMSESLASGLFFPAEFSPSHMKCDARNCTLISAN